MGEYMQILAPNIRRCVLHTESFLRTDQDCGVMRVTCNVATQATTASRESIACNVLDRRMQTPAR